MIGVTPAGFFGDTLRADPAEMWIPLHQEPLIAGGGSLLRQPVSAWLRAIGRLRPGATTDGMAPRFTGLLRHWIQYDSQYPANWMAGVMRDLPNQTISIVPAGSGVGVMKEEYGRSLQILLGVCGLVLLIACANVANLLLARAVARRGQTALRLAIGASASQIVMQALVESVLLAVGGALAGLLVAIGAARLLLALAFSRARFLPISAQPSFLVLGFALRARPGHRHHLRRGAGVVRDAHRPGRRAPRRRPSLRATTRLWPARRSWSCRRRSPSSSSPARRCWRGA